MTVSNSVATAITDGNGVTTSFNVPFRILAESHLSVVILRADGSEDTLVLNSDYTVSGVGDPNATVVTSVAPAVGEKIARSRNVPLDQLVDYVGGDKFPAETHESAIDKLTMIAQQQRSELDRTLRVSVFGDASNPVDPDDLQTVVTNAPKISNVSDNMDAVEAVHDNMADVNAVASNLTPIGTVASNVAAVVAVSTDIAKVGNVSDNMADVNTLAGNVSAILAAAQTATDKAAEAALWAEEDEDVEVEPGLYSAKHWASKAEEISVGVAANISYDSSGVGLSATDVQGAVSELWSSARNLNKVTRVTSSNATWPLQGDTRYVLVQGVGGGGAGGGAQPGGATNAAAGGGGGSGAISSGFFDVSAISSLALVVGAGGAPDGAGGVGGNGGTSSYSDGTNTISCPGGVGGGAGVGQSYATSAPGSGPTSAPTGGHSNVPGASGLHSLAMGDLAMGTGRATACGGHGADAPGFGAGGVGGRFTGSSGFVRVDGSDATGRGAGGGGGTRCDDSGFALGGNGAPGAWLIWEFN